MTPDLLAQLVLYLLCLAAVIWRKQLAEFLDACSHCEGWIRSEEAKSILAVMQKVRVG